MTIRASDGRRDDRDEIAAGWCMRLAEAPLSADEQRAFTVWVADPGNAAALDDAIALWDAAAAAADKPEMIHARSAALELFRKSNSRRWLRRDRRWTWISAAAAALLVVIASTLLLLRDPAQTYQTGIGERRIAMLEDGSRLSLDAATAVEVRMRDDRRELSLLGGRARFDVARDPLRPFRVVAGDKIVVATGTSFSVELLGDQVRVLLYEGHVEVLDRGGSAARPRPVAIRPGAGPPDASPPEPALVPGRELVTRLASAAATVALADPVRSSSWEAGQLSFENEPLPTALARVNRYAREPLVIGDEATRRLRVNGVFSAGDTAALVEGLEALYGVRASHDGDRLRLTRR